MCDNLLGKNTRGSVAYIVNGLSNRFTEVPGMKETIWMGVGSNVTLRVALIFRFVNNPPRNTRRYNPNITKQSDGGTKRVTYINADILVMVHMCRRIV
jgi:hypothetical protein